MKSGTSPFSGSSTTYSLGALVIGLILGSALHQSSIPPPAGIASFIELIGTLWVRALQMIVMPLVVSLLIVAVVSTRDAAAVGRLGATAFATFLVLLGAGALFAATCVPPLLQWVQVDPATMATLPKTIPGAAQDALSKVGDTHTVVGWLSQLVPANPLRAMVEGNILQVIVFTVPFALAITMIKSQYQRRLRSFFQAMAETMLVMVRAILWATPLGVFALAFSFSSSAGLQVASVLIQFALIVSGLLLAFTLLLYPLTVLFARVPLLWFARSLYQGQIVAVTTRSSLAALPALIIGAKSRLRLPPEVVGFALPFSASVFKVNRTISSSTKLLFLAHLYDVYVGPFQFIAFVIVVIFLSFSTVGIPGGGASFKTLPAYLAMGIPIEGIVLLEVIDVIPDIFKTLVNVTGYMTAAAMVARFGPAGSTGSGSEQVADLELVGAGDEMSP